MKRFIVLFGLVFAITAAFADTNICRKNNTLVILLSKSTNGQSATSDASDKTWSVTFNYTTMSVQSRTSSSISGEAACNEISGSANTPNTALITSVTDEGTNCWCSMTAPAISYWVFNQTYGTSAACASGCAAACASSVNTSTLFRTGMFGAIW